VVASPAEPNVAGRDTGLVAFGSRLFDQLGRTEVWDRMLSEQLVVRCSAFSLKILTVICIKASVRLAAVCSSPSHTSTRQRSQGLAINSPPSNTSYVPSSLVVPVCPMLARRVRVFTLHLRSAASYNNPLVTETT